MFYLENNEEAFFHFSRDSCINSVYADYAMICMFGVTAANAFKCAINSIAH